MSHHEVLPTSAAELGKDFLIFDKDVFRWGLGRKGHNKSFDIYIHERRNTASTRDILHLTPNPYIALVLIKCWYREVVHLRILFPNTIKKTANIVTAKLKHPTKTKVFCNPIP
jgi:hypothetical protein